MCSSNGVELAQAPRIAVIVSAVEIYLFICIFAMTGYAANKLESVKCFT